MDHAMLSRGIRLHLTGPPLAVGYSAEQIAGIFGGKTIDVLNTKPHVELANLRDDRQALVKFVKKWGPIRATANFLIDASDTDITLNIPSNQAVKNLRASHPSVNSFFVFSHGLLIEYRDKLRKAWDGDRVALETLRNDVAMQGSSMGFRS